MSLTRDPGPLAGHPGNTNYSIDGPQHRLLATPLPRRVRGEVAGRTVIDTDGAFLLHETGLSPQLYVPLADVDDSVLERTQTSSHCPFKGDASYRTVAGSTDALWVYDEPLPAASWLQGYAGVYLDRFDRWLDEDDEVRAFPDPYHRVDVRSTSAHVEVHARGELIAASDRALLLSETALPNRYYLPVDDVVAPLSGPTQTSTFCPYKGTASYWTVTAPGGELVDGAWSYEDPHPECAAVKSYVSFWGDDVEITATRT